MAQLSFISIDQSGAGTTNLISASPGERHKVRGCVVVLAGAGTVKFTDGTDDLTGAMSLDAKSGFVLPPAVMEYFRTPSNAPLQVVTTGAAAKGSIVVVTEP